MDNTNWTDIRYEGDRKDEKELQEVYRVEDFLDTCEEQQRLQDINLRERFLRDGVRLNKRLSPRIFRIYQEICSSLGLEAEAEIFCFTSPDINAYAFLDQGKASRHNLVGITSTALEKLEDAELKFIIGHELGHFLFQNHRYKALVNTDKQKNAATVLPTLGEMLFLRWQKKQEISADRVGLLASGDFASAATALLKTGFGLSEKNLVLDVEGLMKQIDEIKGKPELVRAEFDSHPLLPIRLKALELFAASAKAARHGYPAQGKPVPDAKLEAEVDALVALTKRYPGKPLAEAVMKVIALGGVLLLSADGDADHEEVKIVLQLLYERFTDDPEREIVTDIGELKEQLKSHIGTINRDGDLDDKNFILCRLADIALADGALLDIEGNVIIDIAQRLELPERTALSIIIGAAQAGNLRVDAKLNRISDAIRGSLISGMKLK